MHFRKVGAQAAAPAFQVDGRTWYAATGPAVLCVIDGLTQPESIDWAKLGKGTATARKAAVQVHGELPDTAGGHRAAALLHARAGDGDAAISALETAIGLKKVFPDTWALLGDARWAAGEKAAAKKHYAVFIKKARRKDFPEAYERAKTRAG
jgi:hypothetical protein